MFLRTVFLNACSGLVILGATLQCSTSRILVNARGAYPPQLETESVMKMPSDSVDPVFTGLHRKDDIIAFYRMQSFELVWHDSGKLLPAADSLLHLIHHVRYFGLLPITYHSEELDELNRFRDATNSMRLDALLTDAFFDLSAHIARGVSMRTIADNADSIQVNLLRQVMAGAGLLPTLSSREPVFSGYQSLKDALKLILDTTEANTREQILRDATNDSIHGLKTIETIEVNLERWRMEHELSVVKKHIFINVPSFMLRVVDKDETLFESKVIVGATRTPTPTISSQIECLVIYPYWHVPRKISVEEYLPILQRDTSFITRNNFEVLDRKGNVLSKDSINWKKFSRNYFPVSLRQREGRENSLGIIKFVFDNPYAVYLHDTNAKSLFRKNTRAYSHGCIRLENATGLAHYLFTGDVTKKSKTIEKYITQAQRQTISLPQPVPIYVRYFTCEVINGKLYQYPDLYCKDEVLMKVLHSPESSIKPLIE